MTATPKTDSVSLLLDRDLYEAMLADADPAHAAALEDAEDRAALAAGQARGLTGTVPIEVIRAKREGAHPVRAWRTARGLTLQALAAASGVGKGHIGHIEKGRRHGTVETLRRLAGALQCTVDDLVPRIPARHGG